MSPAERHMAISLATLVLSGDHDAAAVVARHLLEALTEGELS